MDEAQAGIKITGRNINNLTDATDMALMAESEELKILLMKMKGDSEKFNLKANFIFQYPLSFSSRGSLVPGILLFFSMIQQILTFWSLVPLPFLHPAYTSASSQITWHSDHGIQSHHIMANRWGNSGK